MFIEDDSITKIPANNRGENPIRIKRAQLLQSRNTQIVKGLTKESQILKLFPERAIKVSSFIDLIGSQLQENK